MEDTRELLKAHVKGHTRTLKNGKVIEIPEYDTKVVKKQSSEAHYAAAATHFHPNAHADTIANVEDPEDGHAIADAAIHHWKAAKESALAEGYSNQAQTADGHMEWWKGQKATLPESSKFKKKVGHYTHENGVTKWNEGEAPEGASNLAALHQRTAMGENKANGWYLRAANNDDAKAIAEAVYKVIGEYPDKQAGGPNGVWGPKRAGAVHHGNDSAFPHIYFGKGDEAKALASKVYAALEKEKAAPEETAKPSAEPENKPQEPLKGSDGAAAPAKPEPQAQEPAAPQDGADGDAKPKLSPFEMGKAAFHAGKGPAPALNQEFQDAYLPKGTKIGSPESEAHAKAMKEYDKGWTAANLAAPVPDEPEATPAPTKDEPKAQEAAAPWKPAPGSAHDKEFEKKIAQEVQALKHAVSLGKTPDEVIEEAKKKSIWGAGVWAKVKNDLEASLKSEPHEYVKKSVSTMKGSTDPSLKNMYGFASAQAIANHHDHPGAKEAFEHTKEASLAHVRANEENTSEAHKQAAIAHSKAALHHFSLAGNNGSHSEKLHEPAPSHLQPHHMAIAENHASLADYHSQKAEELAKKTEPPQTEDAYAKRVQHYIEKGMSNGDAQGVVDAEITQGKWSPDGPKAPEQSQGSHPLAGLQHGDKVPYGDKAHVEAHPAGLKSHTPFHKPFIHDVKEIGGKWSGGDKTWTVPHENGEQLHGLMEKHFGAAGAKVGGGKENQAEPQAAAAPKKKLAFHEMDFDKGIEKHIEDGEHAPVHSHIMQGGNDLGQFSKEQLQNYIADAKKQAVIAIHKHKNGQSHPSSNQTWESIAQVWAGAAKKAMAALQAKG